MRGDRVEMVVDAGNTTRTYEVVASRAGRRVEAAVRRGVVEVSEVTRWGSPRRFGSGGGTVVRTARFMANRVPTLVEQPVPREESSDKEGRSGRPVGEDPDTRALVSTQGSTSQVAAHPPGGPAIGTRA
ncbi:hypothetical protein SAMN06272771_1394 [Streptomyces sp. Ag82_O1-12]|uniref:hypothetical protein n=1 Tax=unclassified Streptomyces TaxID=2593676 RepID=UPI000BC6E751|nr:MULTISPECIES: hypothetical protein [unclassified Streptomyces]SMQ15070.1 hypothetical protein SAMN06272771_1394 [Streptomyces sp. Ag82_O1-12]SOD44098.1 hypothetical protein SAMN06272727_1385 [Streptomyces sp. Ag82_G6-1]